MDNNKYPRALAFLTAMPQVAIIDWLTHSEIGRTALQALERKLTTQRPGSDSPNQSSDDKE
jgi:hypothetical protein